MHAPDHLVDAPAGQCKLADALEVEDWVDAGKAIDPALESAVHQYLWSVEP